MTVVVTDFSEKNTMKWVKVGFSDGKVKFFQSFQNGILPLHLSYSSDLSVEVAVSTYEYIVDHFR